MKRCNNCFSEYEEYLYQCPFCGFQDGEPAKELYHLFPGSELAGRYIIGEVVGFGGFGITYKAWDKKLEVVVAIKEHYPSGNGLVNRIPGTKTVLLYEKKRQQEYQYGLKRFLDEARSMAKFNAHENIVNVFEYFEENETAYIVMEFLDGISLLDYLKMNEIDFDSSIEIIRQVCNALKDIHKAGIIHRDVSPDNIFLCMNGKVKLIDFGAARFSPRENQQQKMTIILKPGYAPYEQYSTVGKQGPWSDVYAVGATLYMMLTSTKPQEATNRNVNDQLIEPVRLNPNISENMNNTILKAMAMDIPLRFSSIEQFEKALLGEKKIISLETERKERKKKRISGMIVATVALGIGIGMFTVNWNKQKQANALPDADIVLWYVEQDEEEFNRGKEEAFEAIITEFTQTFTNITITYEGIDESNYMEEFQQSIENGEVVHIFESTNLEAEWLNENAIDVLDIVNHINVDKYVGFHQYKDTFKNQNQIPMGMNVPAIYCNKSVVTVEDTMVSSLADFMKANGKNHDIAVARNMKNTFDILFGEEVDEKYVHIVDSVDDFVKNEYAFYFASTEEHLLVQSALPARYQIITLDLEKIPVVLTDLYSIHKNCSEEEIQVAEKFLEFMLSDNSQDYLYIRNQHGVNPINKNVLELLESIYQELDGFFDNMKNYQFQI